MATRNPIPSEAPEDLKFNAGKIDEVVSSDAEQYVDRLDKRRFTVQGLNNLAERQRDTWDSRFQNIAAQYGWRQIPYVAGNVLELRTDYVEISGEGGYSLNYDVPLPYTLTGDWATESVNFTRMSDATLRADLADPEKGAELVSRTIVTAQSIDEIKEITPGAGKVCLLTDGLREGAFSWRHGDFSGKFSSDEFQVIYIQSNKDKTGGAWVRDGDWEKDGVHASWFGFESEASSPVYASTTIGEGPFEIDSSGQFQRASDFCAREGLVFVIDKKYWIYGYIQVRTKTRWKFLKEGELIAAMSDPVMGGFIVGDYVDMSTINPITDVGMWDVNIDLNRMASMNGLAVASLIGGRFHGATRIKNSLHHATNAGGRATQFEGDTCRDIHVDNLYIENCSIGINSQALPSPSAYIASNISYGKVVMKNVGMPFNIDCTDSGSNEINIDRMSTTVGLAVLHNCGRPDWLSASDAYKGGIITGDRGSGLYISTLRVVNDDDYGLVGALLKGTMYGVTVDNADVYGQFISICDFNYLDFIQSASDASHPSWADVNVSYRGGSSSVENILSTKGGGGSLGSCRITVKANPSYISRVCGPNLEIYSNSQIILINAETGKEYPARTPRQFINYGNQFHDVIGYQTVSRLRTDAVNDQPRNFFSVLIEPNGRVSLRITASAIGGGSSSSAASVSYFSLIAIARDGNGNLISNVSGSPVVASAISGYSSCDLTFAVLDGGDGVAHIVIRQVNDLGADMAIFAEAEILSALSTDKVRIIDSPVF